MKKSLFALILCSALFAQAASVTWGVTKEKPDTHLGQTVYLLCTMPDTQTKTYEQILATYVVDSATITRTTGVGPNKIGVPSHTSTDDRITTTANFYLAMFNDDKTELHYVDVSTTLRGGVGKNTTVTVSPVPSAIFGSATSITVLTKVPEPAAGLLLCLGIGSLAMSRRRRRG